MDTGHRGAAWGATGGSPCVGVLERTGSRAASGGFFRDDSETAGQLVQR